MKVNKFRQVSIATACFLTIASFQVTGQVIKHRLSANAQAVTKINKINKFTKISSITSKVQKAEAQGLPSTPRVTKMQETSTLGTVHVEWQAPTTDTNGNSIDPSKVTYRIATGTKNHETTIADSLTQTAINIKAYEPTKQDFVYFRIYAQTSAGESEGTLTPIIPVGPADNSPYKESFAGGELSHNWAVDITNNGDDSEWTMYTDIDVDDLTAQDGDNGYIGAATLSGGDVTSCIKSGKIKVNAEASTLVFYVYNITDPSDPDALDINTVDVIINGDHVTTKHLVISDFNTGGWHKVAVPLKDYVGQIISFNVLTTFNYYTNTFFDNFQLIDFTDPDLKAEAITLTGKTIVDSEFKIRVMTKNIGISTAKDYFVDLYFNGDVVASKPGKAIEPEQCDTTKFPQVLPITASKDNLYYAKIRYADDKNPANNVTDTLHVTLDLPEYPTPLALKGTRDNDTTVTLSWDAPDMSTAIPDETLESFEDYTAWQHSEVGGWTFVDGDNHKIGAFSNFSIAGINGTKQSFWVSDDRYPKFSHPAFYAHTGDKYLAQFFCTDKVQCDDWAISPKLYGGKQTIKLYARSFSDKYLETMEILYSSAGSDTTDFQLAKKIDAVPAAWTEYAVSLPDGTKHFAVRCTSTDKMMLMVDDATFVPEGATSSLTLKGYNVYRDNVMLNTSLIETTSFTDTTTDASAHKYVVTAIYDRGESCPSNLCCVAPASVTGTHATQPTVTVHNGGITISNASEAAISVFTIDGKLIKRCEAATAPLSVQLPCGIYCVTVGGKASKVIIR